MDCMGMVYYDLSLLDFKEFSLVSLSSSRTFSCSFLNISLTRKIFFIKLVKPKL